MNKEQYFSPDVDIIHIWMEGPLCSSGDLPGYDVVNPETIKWG